MDIEQTKKAIEIMQAFVEGRKIETYYNDGRGWVGVTDPTWNWFAGDYRIAKRKEKRTGWINVYPTCTAGVYDTEVEANDSANPGRIACIKIEYEV